MPLSFHIETSVKHGDDEKSGEFDCRWLSYDWVPLDGKAAGEKFKKMSSQAGSALGDQKSALSELHKIGIHRRFSALVDEDEIDMSNLHDLIFFQQSGDTVPITIELLSWKDGDDSSVAIATLNAKVKLTGLRLTGTGYVFNFKIIGGIDEDQDDAGG